MAAKKRFTLKMADGYEVYALYELKEHFDLQSVLEYYLNGKLTTWLSDRYYIEKSERIDELFEDDDDFIKQLCDIVEVDYSVLSEEEIKNVINLNKEKNDTLMNLSAESIEIKEFQNTVSDNSVASEIKDDNHPEKCSDDNTATTQEEMTVLISKSPKKIYLKGERFEIPFTAKNICFTGIENPLVILDGLKQYSDYEDENITFSYVKFEQSGKIHTKGEKLFLEGKYSEAVPFLENEVTNGISHAIILMWELYQNGFDTVDIDRNKANELLINASALNDPIIEFQIEINKLKKQPDYDHYEQETKKLSELISVIWSKFLSMSNSGDAIAQYYLGHIYIYGNETIRNFEKAFEFFSRSAGAGYVPADFQLGNCYINGQGVERNYSVANEWFNKAADSGYYDAKKKLGKG